MSKESLAWEFSPDYHGLLSSITELERGRLQAAKSVNAILTATYWSIDRHLVEYEEERAAYGSERC